MVHLTQAHRQLFARSPDERFATLMDLTIHCQARKEASQELWEAPTKVAPLVGATGALVLNVGTDGAAALNDWSFGQLCRLAGVHKETVNRLMVNTAQRVLTETLPRGTKPWQLLTLGDTVRSIHGTAYSRLYDADLLQVVQEFATDFQPPQPGATGGTGLYAGQQDMFCFLVDPAGWAEIDDQAFAPGFFLFNSEVGRRAVGISTFWFQAVCANHLVWDAVEVVEVHRRHTGAVHEILGAVRRAIEHLVEQRDARRDGFVRVVRQAMRTALGDDADEALKVLHQHGIPRDLGRRVIEAAQRQGRLTIFSVVDALTRLSQELSYAGDRTEADQRASQLLSLAV